MKVKTIKVREDNWKRLMRWKLDLGCSNLDEVIDRILRIVPASELKEVKKK